ncbi:MAG: toxin-antitoxin system YwqK family antitoxin [Saprospiraceae bacterium]|jgi:antitoxin component YwqK of YwqJK toxin-antitoxin module|nr:toxin-antitoxin system YwqK family antitoxin [Saprospiraceae bacterium]
MYAIVPVIFLFFISCSQKQTIQDVSIVRDPPEIFISTSDTALHNNNGTWFYKNLKANGYIIEKKGDALIAKLPVVDGKENGIALGWFETGEKRYERSFINGDRDGTHKIWYKNGQLGNVNFYKNDKLEGEQISYFESGNLWQSLHYVNGYEEGKQKTWNDSARVINNFTVKNGKLYGVIGRYDCMSVVQK